MKKTANREEEKAHNERMTFHAFGKSEGDILLFLGIFSDAKLFGTHDCFLCMAEFQE